MPERNSVETTVRFHHIAVQTASVDLAASWYKEFLGCRQTWSSTTFSELTASRLPGVRRLVDVSNGDLRIRLFEREVPQLPAPTDSLSVFQHLSIQIRTPMELVGYREQWRRLYASGRYTFAVNIPPTPISEDSSGRQRFYAYDLNGLGLELAFTPPIRANGDWPPAAQGPTAYP